MPSKEQSTLFAPSFLFPPVSAPFSSQSSPVAKTLPKWPAVSQVIHHHRWTLIIGWSPVGPPIWQISCKCQPSVQCADWFWQGTVGLYASFAPLRLRPTKKPPKNCRCLPLSTTLFTSWNLGFGVPLLFAPCTLLVWVHSMLVKPVCAHVWGGAFAPTCTFSASLLKTHPSNLCDLASFQ